MLEFPAVTHFVIPAATAYSEVGTTYLKNFSTYSQYNYLRPGLISALKRNRFETALKLAKPYFGCSAIDMGCADGIFLPSLSKHFRNVIGVDVRSDFIAQSEMLVKACNLRNVSLVLSAGKNELALPIAKVMFLLETLEHIGDKERLYESKAGFVEYCMSMVADGGILIVSVPRMTGLPFILKYAIQFLTRAHREKFTFSELLASLLGSTENLQKHWDYGHKGFDELKLASALSTSFRVSIHKTATSLFFVIR